ncbi:unnamed protein product, partial [Trichogramma brassicae]
MHDTTLRASRDREEKFARRRRERAATGRESEESERMTTTTIASRDLEEKFSRRRLGRAATWMEKFTRRRRERA